MQPSENFFRSDTHALIPQYSAGKPLDTIDDHAISQSLAEKVMNPLVTKVSSNKVFGKFYQRYSFDTTLESAGTFIRSQIRQNPILEDEEQSLRGIFSMTTLCRALNSQNSLRSLQNKQIHHTIKQIMIKSGTQIPVQLAQMAHSIGTIRTQRGIIESISPVIDIDTDLYRACFFMRPLLDLAIRNNIAQQLTQGAKILLNNDAQVQPEIQETFKYYWNKHICVLSYNENLQIQGQVVNFVSFFPEIRKFMQQMPIANQRIQWIQLRTQPGQLQNKILAIHSLASGEVINNIQLTNAALQQTGYQLVNITRPQLQTAILQAIDVYSQQIQPGIQNMKPVTFEPSVQGQLSQLVNRDTTGILPRYSVVTPVTQLDMYLGIIFDTNVEVKFDDFTFDTSGMPPFKAMQMIETNNK